MRSRYCPYVCVCVRVSVYPPLSLLGDGSVKIPLLLLGNGYVFYAVRVISKESRRLVLPRTFCCFIKYKWNPNMRFSFFSSITFFSAHGIHEAVFFMSVLPVRQATALPPTL
jgi:hypothetical protein